MKETFEVYSFINGKRVVYSTHFSEQEAKENKERLNKTWADCGSPQRCEYSIIGKPKVDVGQERVRELFWQFLSEVRPELAEHREGKRQNDYYADIRMMFVQFIDGRVRDGEISKRLAYRVTL